MNIIPSTFDQRQIAHTVLGGSETPSRILMPVSCVVLSRSNPQYRSRIFENLSSMGFEKIVSAESSNERVSTNQLVQKFPEIKFLVAQEKVTQGDLMNLAFAECRSPFILVLQDEMCVEKFQFNPSMAKSLMERNQLCFAPRLFASNMQKLPVIFFPSARKSVFEVESSMNFYPDASTLYASDLAGFYSREKYVSLGGIDYTITSEYWQKIDFFFRAWLWGEKVTVSSSLEFSYFDEIPVEDQTVDISYLRFYLKNLLPVFEVDHARIPGASFLAFKSRSSCGFVESMRQFKDAVRWTRENQYRFRLDAVKLMEGWEVKLS